MFPLVVATAVASSHAGRGTLLILIAVLLLSTGAAIFVAVMATGDQQHTDPLQKRALVVLIATPLVFILICWLLGIRFW